MLRVGALTTLGTMDIRVAEDSVSGLILSEVFEPPYGAPIGDAPPQPQLFSGPLREDRSDPKRPLLLGTVRPGVRFSDGTPLTAGLMARSLNATPDFAVHATASARTDETITFSLKLPNARFELYLSQTLCGIVLEKDGRLLGTGPYVLPAGLRPELLERTNPLVLTRNPHHRRQTYFDELQFTSYPAPNGGTERLLDAMRSPGEVDFTYSLTSVDAAQLQGQPYTPSISVGNATGILHFNCEVPKLRDPSVRRALALSIDRLGLAKLTYEKNPTAFVARRVVPALLTRSFENDRYNHDLKEAQRLATGLGNALPKQLSLLTIWSPRPYLPNPRRAAEFITAQLRELGVSVTIIKPKSYEEFFRILKRGGYDLVLAGWIADTPDPADFLDALCGSTKIPTATVQSATSNNLSRWRSPAMDAALLRLRQDPTHGAFGAISSILDAEVPFVPLIHGQAVAVRSNRLQGFRASSLGRSSLGSLELSSV